MPRKAALLFFTIVLVVILLPAAVVSLGPFPARSPQDRGCDSDVLEEGAGNSTDLQLHLYRSDRGEIVVVDLEEYLAGVLLAEMPSSFEMEALKAQAVIARTYTLNKMRALGGSGCSRSPRPADICSDSTHCQAWLDPVETAVEWGPESEISLGRIREAIAETRGEVALYQGGLIEAVYHSTCGGKTEASSAVWSGSDPPYLQSVNCPYCEHSPHYRGELLIPFPQLADALPQNISLPAVAGERIPLKAVSNTPGERVAELELGGVVIEGKELRRLLGLPSTAFTATVTEKGLLFHTRGRGHGVGLCQYGADGAAREGQDYRQIIMFYYPGVDVTKFFP